MKQRPIRFVNDLLGAPAHDIIGHREAFQFVTEGVCHEGKPLRIDRQVTRQVFGRKQFQKFQRASGAKAMRKRKGKFTEAAKSDEIEGGKSACEQGKRLRNGR